MASPKDWASGMPYVFDRRDGKPAAKTVPVSALFLGNVPGEMKIVIADRETGKTIDLPDDGIIFAFINRAAAESLRDDLLNPDEFPDVVT